MAEQTKTLEREYVIPLRREWVRVPVYERTGRAIKAIKKFIAKHMKVLDRDVNNVKLDVYFNNELWFRGRANPPAKIKVRAIKEGEIVRVNFVETPEHVKMLKSKHEKLHKAAEKKPEMKSEKKEETPEEKKEETEKEKAVAEERLKEMKQEAKAEKHVTKVEKAQHPQRMALQK
jgi:large subunit ribosomal protein L31e